MFDLNEKLFLVIFLVSLITRLLRPVDLEKTYIRPEKNSVNTGIVGAAYFFQISFGVIESYSFYYEKFMSKNVKVIVLFMILNLVSCASNKFTSERVFIGNQELTDNSKLVDSWFDITNLDEGMFQINYVSSFPVFTADAYRVDEVKKGGLDEHAVMLNVVSLGLSSLLSCGAAAYELGKDGVENRYCTMVATEERKEGELISFENKIYLDKTSEVFQPLKNNLISIYAYGALIDTVLTDEQGMFSIDEQLYLDLYRGDLFIEGSFRSRNFKLLLPELKRN